MRIAMISEHASPLAALGGVDAGGQNAHVADLSVALAEHGHEIRVYTRRDSPGQPEVVPLRDGVDVVHVPVGPPAALPKDELLPYMGEFAEWMAADWRREWPPDVAHAHFWMSGLAAVTAGRACGVPVVQTFHALGSVKRRHQGVADTSSPHRIGYERELGRAVDRVIVQCQDEIGELLRLGIPRARTALIPSGVNVERFRPDGPVAARETGRARILTVARLVERKGIEDLIRALPEVPGAELVVAGGPQSGELLAHRGLRGRRSGPPARCGRRRRDAGLVPLGRRARRHPVVRAVRAHPAGGDGVRGPGGGRRGRRPH
jgi:D-inositol-3-phosphate glycosyltransferase